MNESYCIPAPVSQPMVQQRMNELEDTLCRTDSVIELLYDKLNPVCVVSPTEKATAGEHPVPNMSPLAAQINRRNYELRKLNEKLEALLDMLEV